jgi:hypothetical protein
MTGANGAPLIIGLCERMVKDIEVLALPISGVGD